MDGLTIATISFICGAVFVLWYQKLEERDTESKMREIDWRYLGEEINSRLHRLGVQPLSWSSFAEHATVTAKLKAEILEARKHVDSKGTFQVDGLEEIYMIVQKSILYVNRSPKECEEYKKSSYSPSFHGSYEDK